MSRITSPTIVYSTVYWGAHQRKHQSSVSLAFVWGIHRWPVNSPHKRPVTRKMFPFDDVIMIQSCSNDRLTLGTVKMKLVTYELFSNGTATLVDGRMFLCILQYRCLHYTYVIRASWRLKPPANRQITEHFFHANIRQNIKVPHCSPYARGFHR